jgi:hypothetical protein
MKNNFRVILNHTAGEFSCFPAHFREIRIQARRIKILPARQEKADLC